MLEDRFVKYKSEAACARIAAKTIYEVLATKCLAVLHLGLKRAGARGCSAPPMAVE